ncbi:uncharacterized protein LOC144928698 [Branchiostoma floridae x Branchiostoma belcheri]
MDLVEGHVGLHVDVANQNLHVATDKNQPKTSTSQPQMDSGCYSIGPSTSCDTAQNGGSLSKEEPENDGKEEQHDNIAVKDSEAVVTEQPSPPQPACEGAANNVQEAARSIQPESTDTGTPYLDSHHNASGETLRVSSDRTVSLNKTIHEPKLHCTNVAIREKFRAIETRMHEKRYILVDRGNAVDTATLLKVLQETCQEMFEDMENLQSFAEMMADSTSSESLPNIKKGPPDSKNTKAVQTNPPASTTSTSNSILMPSPSEDQDANTTVEEQTEEKKDEKKPGMLKDDVSESIDLEPKNTPDHSTDNVQEEPKAIGKETLGLHNQKDLDQMQQLSESPRHNEELQSGEPPEEELGDSASSYGPSNSCKKNKQPSVGQRQDDMSTEDQDRKKQEGDKTAMSHKKEKKTESEDEKEDRVLPNKLLSSGQASKEKKNPGATNSLEEKAKPEEPTKNVVVPSPGKEDQGKDKSKSEVASNNEGQPKKVPTNTQVKSGQSGDQTKRVLSRNPLKENPAEDKDKTGVPSNTQVKRRQSEEPKSGLPNQPFKEDPPEVKDKTGVPEKNGLKTILPNNPRNKGHKDKDKADHEVLSNTQVKKPQSKEPEKNGVLPKKTVKEDPLEVKDKTGVAENNTVTPNNPKKGGHQDKDKAEVPSNNQVKRGQSVKSGALPKEPLKEDPPEVKDETGVPKKNGVLPNNPRKKHHQDKDKADVPSNTHVKRGQTEKPEKSRDLSNDNLLKEGNQVKDKTPVPSNTRVKKPQSKSGLPNEPFKEHPPEVKNKTGVPEKNGVQAVLPNNPRKKSHKDKDKADHEVLSNTQVKKPQSNEPKSGDLLREPPKEDPPEVKDKTGVAEKKVVRTVLPNNPRKEGRQDKDKAEVPSNTQVKRGQSEEPGKNGRVLPLVHSNTQVKRPQSNEPKSVDLPKKPLKEDPKEVKEDQTGVPEKNRVRTGLPNRPRKESNQGKDKTGLPSNTQVKRPQSKDPEKIWDLSDNTTKEGYQGKDNTMPVPFNIQVKRPQPEEEEKSGVLLLNKPRKLKEYELIVQTPGNTSSHEEGDKILLEEDIETLKKVKNWMNLKIPSLLALLSFLFDLLKAWSHKEEPPDVTSNHKTTNTTPVPVDQDALIYNVQRQDEEVLRDSSDESDDEEQDGYHQPVWLAQLADDSVEDEEDLYLGSEDTIAFPEPGAAEPGAAAGPMFCSEVPENGQIAVGGGVSNPSQVGVQS